MDLIFFLDENLGNCKPILESLTKSGVRYERYHDHFDPGVEDAAWLRFVGERGWVVLTKDKRTRYNQLEKATIRRYKVAEFYFGSGNMSGAEMGSALDKAISSIRRICEVQQPPFIGRISKSGIVTLVENSRGSTHERKRRRRTT